MKPIKKGRQEGGSKEVGEEEVNRTSARFQFTLGRLAQAVLFAAIAASIFTIGPEDNSALRIVLHGLISFMAGGAAIGVLFKRTLYGAFVGAIAAGFVVVILGFWAVN
jgi:hypothetical protein